MGENRSGLTRRQMLATGAAAAAAYAVPTPTRAVSTPSPAPADVPGEDYKVRSGRIKHSAMAAVLQIQPDALIDAAAKMGLAAVECVGRDPQRLARARSLGLHIGYMDSHGFKTGPLNPEFQPDCEKALISGIDRAVQFQSQNVITFTGMRKDGISDEQACRNCVEFWKRIAPYAEKHNVNLALEMLNTRDGSGPMTGHPGYFGNDVELCIDLIKKVDSPRMKLLFDVYHVQIMNGDVIRRLRTHKDYISHVHVAGVPGRTELDPAQELNYPGVMNALLDIGYTGFVAQEFIPRWPDKLAALRYSVRVCDV